MGKGGCKTLAAAAANGVGVSAQQGGRTERCVGGDAVRGGRLAVHQIPNSASGREAKPVLKRGAAARATQEPLAKANRQAKSAPALKFP